MLAWHVPYLGWTRLPAGVSEFEIAHFFILRVEERSAVLTRYRDSLRLGAALQIGFLKMCGRPLDAIQRVPADLLKHLGEQLEIPVPTIATLRALYLKRRRTLYEHQRWAMEFLGMIRFEPTDTDKLLPSLCDVVRAGVSGDHLLTATRKLLYENRFVIPGTRRLSNLMQAAVSSVERDALSAIERTIPVLIRNRWLDALSGLADPERKMTLLEYLQEPPAKFSASTIERQSGKVAELRNLGVDTYKTDMVPALLQSYAQVCGSAGLRAFTNCRSRAERWSWWRLCAMHCWSTRILSSVCSIGGSRACGVGRVRRPDERARKGRLQICSSMVYAQRSPQRAHPPKSASPPSRRFSRIWMRDD
jgi:hypothetical protein